MIAIISHLGTKSDRLLDQDTNGAGVPGNRRVYDADNQLFWWIPVQCPEVENESFPVIIYGDAGSDPANPRQRVVVSARIRIGNTNEGAGGSEDNNNNDGGGVLSELFGEFSAITQAASLQGSGKVFGNIAAVAAPNMTGNPTFDGSFTEITANAYDEHRAVVNGYFNALAGLGYSSGTLNKVPTLGGHPFLKSELSPSGWRGFNLTWNINDWQEFNLTKHKNQDFMGQKVTVIPLSELDIKSDASVNITGGNVVLYVDGDVDLAGNARFTIDSDSSLALVMTGQFTLQGSFSFAYRDVDTGEIYTDSQMETRVLNKNNHPIFSVYTQYVQTKKNDQGVRVQGNTNLYGVIYAANSDVRITGSGDVWGSVFGNNVDVEGNASIRFATGGIASGPSKDQNNPGQEEALSPTLDSEFDYDFPEHLVQCTE